MKILFLSFSILLFGGTTVAAARMPAGEESITVTVVGTLQTGIVAIGGETTGTTITAKNITWELDFGKSAAFRKAAERFHAKTVIVQGRLERRKGVEIKERWIVTVTELQPVGEAGVGGKQSPSLHATVGRADTRIRFTSEGDKTILDITSGSGIDKATIRRKSDEWPKSVLVRLHLGGLESFRASRGEIAIEWSVSSTGDNSSRVSWRKGTVETPLDSASPYYTQVRIVGGNAKIPLQGGYFEVPLPAELLEGNPEEISLRWIDFYRN